jgi:hypothetical protein
MSHIGLLKKPVLISLVSHAIAIALFNFSFGNRLSVVDFPQVSFLGGLLPHFALKPSALRQGAHQLYRDEGTAFVQPLAAHQEFPGLSNICEKPPVGLMRTFEKIPAVERSRTDYRIPAERQSVVMFHPLLPLYFGLYFADRQTAHIELLYKINSGQKKLISMKRRISSGNLDVDLLAMRYIGHYLFIQRTILPTDNWQTVKIDLSAKDD